MYTDVHLNTCISFVLKKSVRCSCIYVMRTWIKKILRTWIQVVLRFHPHINVCRWTVGPFASLSLGDSISSNPVRVINMTSIFLCYPVILIYFDSFQRSVSGRDLVHWLIETDLLVRSKVLMHQQVWYVVTLSCKHLLIALPTPQVTAGTNEWRLTIFPKGLTYADAVNTCSWCPLLLFVQGPMCALWDVLDERASRNILRMQI